MDESHVDCNMPSETFWNLGSISKFWIAEKRRDLLRITDLCEQLLQENERLKLELTQAREESAGLRGELSCLREILVSFNQLTASTTPIESAQEESILEAEAKQTCSPRPGGRLSDIVRTLSEQAALENPIDENLIAVKLENPELSPSKILTPKNLAGKSVVHRQCKYCFKRFTGRNAVSLVNRHQRLHLRKWQNTKKSINSIEKSSSDDFMKKSMEKSQPHELNDGDDFLRNSINSSKTISPRRQAKRNACSQCTASFTLRARLLKHLFTEHGVQADEEQMYQCGFCGCVLGSSGDLRRHENIHTQAICYRCRLCEKSSGRRDVISKHLQLVHQMPSGAHLREYIQLDRRGNEALDESAAMVT